MSDFGASDTVVAETLTLKRRRGGVRGDFKFQFRILRYLYSSLKDGAPHNTKKLWYSCKRYRIMQTIVLSENPSFCQKPREKRK